MPNRRIKAVEILQKILEDKVFFSDLKSYISAQELPFLNMLILTTLRYLTALDKTLTMFLKKKIPNKHRFAHYALLTAMAEIIFMKTPPHAVINETVENIKRNTDKFLAGLANNILRKIAGNKESYFHEIQKNSCLPPDFKSILEGYSSTEIQNINKAVKNISPLDITAKKSPAELAEELHSTLLPNGTIRLIDKFKINELPRFSEGLWWVQDVSASLPVLLLGDIKGKKIVDLCAAPGGKTAQLLAAGAEVTAVDIDARRLEKLNENICRLNLNEKLTVVCCDALKFIEETKEKFDIILLDAPCSATGTFRRHPEILHIKNRNDVKMQASLQKQLLNECEKILKVGGFLMYSVCSIAKEEGEYQISDFLDKKQNFKRVPLDLSLISHHGRWQDNLLTPQGDIRTLPYFCSAVGGMDSFFICKMQRII